MASLFLWLWHRPPATTPIRPLAWEPPYAVGAALEMAKRQNKNKNKKKQNKQTKKKNKKKTHLNATLCLAVHLRKLDLLRKNLGLLENKKSKIIHIQCL